MIHKEYKMKCSKCNSEMLLLMTSYVCDRCNPPKGGLVSVKEEDVAENVWGLTIQDIDFCFNNSIFEVTMPGNPNSIMFVNAAAREIYEYILEKNHMGKALEYPCVLELRHVNNVIGERCLKMTFSGYNLWRVFSDEEYVRLLRFMKPHVLGK